jgi:hypothetical protein
MPSPTETIEQSQVKTFISQIFKIVGESLKTAMPNNQKINDLLENAVTGQNGSVDTLFNQLASEVSNNDTVVATIHSKRDEYKKLITDALEAAQPLLGKGDGLSK